MYGLIHIYNKVYGVVDVGFRVIHSIAIGAYDREDEDNRVKQSERYHQTCVERCEDLG